jgi:hypothetical protein
MHWLAYWNDVESINYILSLIEPSKDEIVKMMMPNIRKITPLDVAGKHQSHESALLLLEYVKDNFKHIAEVFEVKNIPETKNKFN